MCKGIRSVMKKKLVNLPIFLFWYAKRAAAYQHHEVDDEPAALTLCDIRSCLMVFRSFF